MSRIVWGFIAYVEFRWKKGGIQQNKPDEIAEMYEAAR
jgi:hypothetical protein